MRDIKTITIRDIVETLEIIKDGTEYYLKLIPGLPTSQEMRTPVLTSTSQVLR